MQYVCRIGTPEGQVRQELRRGRDVASLTSELEREGYHVFEVKPRRTLGRFALPRLGRGAKPISMRALLLFNQELAALLAAGLPLLQALDLVLERIRDPELKSVLNQVRDRVKSGSELSAAFAEFREVFPPLYPSTLKAGERSGEMESVIRRFIRYQRLVMEARKRVTSALIYPAVLIALAIGMMMVMTIFVMPRFTVFYADLGAELPALTRAILTVSIFLRDNWPVLSVGAVVGSFLFVQWKRTEAGALVLDRWKLRIPLLGKIFHRMGLAELCRSLSTLLSGGIPLLSALETSVGAVGNRSMRVALHPTIKMVREGSSFHAALDETGQADDIVIDMAKVGEATGALDVMLSNVADFFDEETETQLQRIVGLIEPIMLVIMGLIIGTLLLAVYLPLFSALGSMPS